VEATKELPIDSIDSVNFGIVVVKFFYGGGDPGPTAAPGSEKAVRGAASSMAVTPQHALACAAYYYTVAPPTGCLRALGVCLLNSRQLHDTTPQSPPENFFFGGRNARQNDVRPGLLPSSDLSSPCPS